MKDFLDGKDIKIIEERFDQWAGNLGALHKPTSPLSLEYRLRDAPLVRTSIINFLVDLHTSVRDGKFPMVITRKPNCLR